MCSDETVCQIDLRDIQLQILVRTGIVKQQQWKEPKAVSRLLTSTNHDPTCYQKVRLGAMVLATFAGNQAGRQPAKSKKLLEYSQSCGWKKFAWQDVLSTRARISLLPYHAGPALHYSITHPTWTPFEQTLSGLHSFWQSNMSVHSLDDAGATYGHTVHAESLSDPQGDGNKQLCY